MWQIEVTLASSDLDATHRLLGLGLGLPPSDENLFTVGRSVIAVVPAAEGQSSGVAYLTLSGGDVAAATSHLLRRGYRATGGDEAPEFVIQGVRVRLEEKARGDIASTPSGVRLTASRIDHVGVASNNSTQLARVFDEVLGFSLESRQIDTQLDLPIEMFSSDKYGVVSHTQKPRPAGALLVTFLDHPGGDIEILEDIMPTAAVPPAGPGSTTGDNKAIANFVQRRGPGLHHVAFRVIDMSASIAQLKDAGIAMIDDCGRPGSRRAQIAFVDRRSVGGIVAHLVQRRDRDDPASA